MDLRHSGAKRPVDLATAGRRPGAGRGCLRRHPSLHLPGRPDGRDEGLDRALDLGRGGEQRRLGIAHGLLERLGRLG